MRSEFLSAILFNVKSESFHTCDLDIPAAMRLRARLGSKLVSDMVDLTIEYVTGVGVTTPVTYGIVTGNAVVSTYSAMEPVEIRAAQRDLYSPIALGSHLSQNVV